MVERLTFRPYSHGDYDEIEPRADFAEQHAAMNRPFCHAPPPGRAWTLLRDGCAVGCGGVVPPEDGRPARAWAYLADLSRRELAQAVRHGLAALAFTRGHDRGPIEASAAADDAGALRTLVRLGFTHTAAEFAYDGRAYVLMRMEA